MNKKGEKGEKESRTHNKKRENAKAIQMSKLSQTSKGKQNRDHEKGNLIVN